MTSQETGLAGEEGIGAQVTSPVLCTNLIHKTLL